MCKTNDQSHDILTRPKGFEVQVFKKNCPVLSNQLKQSMLYTSYGFLLFYFPVVTFSSVWIKCYQTATQNNLSSNFQIAWCSTFFHHHIIHHHSFTPRKTVNRSRRMPDNITNKVGPFALVDVCWCPGSITKSNICWYHISQKEPCMHFWKLVNICTIFDISIISFENILDFILI